MRRDGRGDPYLPFLASAVAAVVLLAVVFVFYPRISRYFHQEGPVLEKAFPKPGEAVPVWVCRDVKGVALLMAPIPDEEAAPRLDRGVSGGPYSYLQVKVYNLAGPESFPFDPPSDGLVSAKGGVRLLPVAGLLRSGAPADLRTILVSLGAVRSLVVPKGRVGQMIFAVKGALPEAGTFRGGNLTFSRREIKREVLAAWRLRPDLQSFQEF